MSEENIAFRLKFLIENLGLSNSQFADKCDITRPTLSQLLSGRNKKISNLIIEQIHTSYPNLSITWLLFGEGDMWLQKSEASHDGTDKCGSDESSATKEKSIANTSGDNSFHDGGNLNNAATKNPSKNTYENPEICVTGKTEAGYRKETGVNITPNASVNPKNEIVNNDICNSEILAQINKIKEKTRKVVQITVYYDDSTFQTFYPNK